MTETQRKLWADTYLLTLSKGQGREAALQAAEQAVLDYDAWTAKRFSAAVDQGFYPTVF